MSRYNKVSAQDLTLLAKRLKPLLQLGSVDTYKAKVSADDTVPAYLSGKITSADTSVVIAVVNDAADEDLDLSVAVYVAAEIATHAADADAHHAPVTQGYGIIVTGQQVAIDTSVIAEVSDLHTAVTLSTDANNNLLSLSGQAIGLDNQNANVIFAGPSTGGAAAPAFRALVDADIPASIARDTELHDAVTLAADAGAILGLTGQQITLDSQSANTVFAGPTTGGAADPTFRALVDADIPSSIARDSEVTSVISTHTADPDAHHDQSHVLATTSALGPDHTVSGLTARQVLIATGASTALFRALEDADIPASIARDSEVTTAVSTHTADADAHHNWPLLDADIPSSIARDSEVTAAISTHASDVNAHHNRSHAITSASDHTVTGAALDVVGLTTTNTLGILTPSAAVSSAVSALLKTDSNGRVRVRGLGINGAPTGDTLYVGGTGTVATLGDGTGAAVAVFNGAAGQVRDMRYQSGGANRWVFRVNNAAESGSDAGSTFEIRPYNDAGTLQAAAISVTRADLGVSFGGSISVTSNITANGNATVGGDLTIATNGNQGDRFLMENSSVIGGSVFYDFNQTDRDAGSTGAFELGFYRDANNITEVRMSKEVFEVIIRSGGTYRFPLEVRAQQVILAELPTSNPGIVGALYRSGGTVLIST